MKEAQDDTADLIDSEPILFLGCSSREIQMLAVVGVFIGLIIGTFVAILTGIGLLVLPFIIAAPMVVLYMGGKRLGKAKEGKPSGYYERLITMRLNALGIRIPLLGIGGTFVMRTGQWRNKR